MKKADVFPSKYLKCCDLQWQTDHRHDRARAARDAEKS